jgi:hypothetical protein
MTEQEHHQMLLKSTQPSGIDEWYCPTCGRRILMCWSPEYKKIVIEVGNELASHSGGKGGVSLQISELISKDEVASEDDPHLAPWANWMEKIHFEDWWDEDD